MIDFNLFNYVKQYIQIINYQTTIQRFYPMSDNTVNVELRQSPTELYKIIKFEGLASSGAEAKQVIADGLVKVNGQTELQKRKKIITGDKVEFNGMTLEIN